MILRLESRGEVIARLESRRALLAVEEGTTILYSNAISPPRFTSLRPALGILLTLRTSHRYSLEIIPTHWLQDLCHGRPGHTIAFDHGEGMCLTTADLLCENSFWL